MTNGIIDSNQKIVTNGLVLHLDAAQRRSYSGSGTVWTDLSGNSNNGTLTNGPTFNSANGGSIVFDGVNDSITITHSSSINLTSTLTLEAWIYPLSLGSSWKAIVYKNNTTNSGGYHMGINPFRFLGGGVKSPSWNSVVSSTNAININEWCCVTMTLDLTNSSIKFFKNGVNIYSGSFSASISGNTDPLMVAQNTGASENLNGIINNVKVYNRALSNTEILQNYNATKSRFEVPALLDLYPNAAAAYSLRKLRSGYTGSAIRVRRSNDNTEQDIGFTSTGDLDTTALTTFVGANNGFVSTWYDQSGNNRNATQTTQANQPTVVSSGSLITITNKVALNFEIVSTYLKYYSVTSFLTQPTTIFATVQGVNVNGQRFISDGSSLNTSQLAIQSSNVLGIYANSSLQVTSTIPLTSPFLAYALFNTTTSQVGVNGKIETGGAGNANMNNAITLGSSGDGGARGLRGKLTEYVIYPNNNSANRIGIETNINSYYGIYNSNIDSDAQSFITAAAITDSTQQGAVDALVKDLKNYGIWTKMRAIYPFVGGTATTHKFNLKDPRDVDGAFRLVFNGGWTHSSTGALPDGSTGYADTKLSPSNLNQNDVHVSFYSRTNFNNTSFQVDIGTLGVNTAFYLSARLSLSYPGVASNLNGSSFSGSGNNLSNGFFLSQRINSSSVNIYRNNVLVKQNTNTSTIPIAEAIVIGRNKDNEFSNRELAFVSLGNSFTTEELTNLYTAVQKYQTTLGRQV